MTNDEFEEIYRLYFHVVFRYLLKLSQNPHVAEELTSDTFFKAMGAIDRFRGDCAVTSWLCQIAKHTYFSYARKDRLGIPPEILDHTELSMEDRIADADTAAAAYDTLYRTLETPYREVFIRRVFRQQSFREIGELFGKSENWACVTYHRAKKKLRAEMEDWL